MISSLYNSQCKLLNSFSQEMAVAECYMEVPNQEETLNIEARNIAQRNLLLQAQSRGFLTRNRLHGYIWHSDFVKKHDFENNQGLPTEVVLEQRHTKFDQVSIDKTKNFSHDISKYSLYPLISYQGGIFEDANSMDLRTQRSGPAESSTNHRESCSHST